MKSFCQRVALTLCSGYIIVYYGELVFWATPDREGMDVGGMIACWLLYSIMAYPFLCAVSLFRVRDPWPMFLAGALYGWFEEGVVVQTTYGSPDTPFPMSISFTALAWHAPLDIWIGWYAIRRALSQDRLAPIAALTLSVGLFYGLWAIFWWNEPPPAMQALLEAGRKDVLLVHFVVFAWGTTALLAVAHWLYQRVGCAEFKPSKFELATYGTVTLLYYGLVTVPAAPRALWVLPPLLGVTCWALNRNRLCETRPDAVVAFAEPIRLRNLACLSLIPLAASSVYFLALAGDLRVGTNYAVYYVATPVGAALWLTAVLRCHPSIKQARAQNRDGSGTARVSPGSAKAAP